MSDPVAELLLRRFLQYPGALPLRLESLRACSPGLLETLRGEGVVVREGARASLLRSEQARFLKEEWPLLRKRLQRMELNLKALIEEA